MTEMLGTAGWQLLGEKPKADVCYRWRDDNFAPILVRLRVTNRDRERREVGPRNQEMVDQGRRPDSDCKCAKIWIHTVIIICAAVRLFNPALFCSH